MNYSIPHASLIEVTMFSCLIVHKTGQKPNFVFYLLEKDGPQRKKVLMLQSIFYMDKWIKILL